MIRAYFVGLLFGLAVNLAGFAAVRVHRWLAFRSFRAYVYKVAKEQTRDQ